ncbi:MAG: homoserine dehydrogenase [Methylophilales bacterium]|jgi:homoserine dehydrogenase|nr:homoserine dehydrogenase [Pseudomonadota bacterium]NQW34855.1 homoserine dehydrogenase [Methylophilales bacterium]HCK03267.1 homoserine dehydrogenase [Methylophilaceae bacterium]|tara:strand:+ start:30570 stop:31886 length:1317 start_codon:yes stop_codon:yes gene_type:complete
MKNKVNIGLIGIGTVGGGTYKVLHDNAEEITRKTGKQVSISHVADMNVELAKKVVSDDTKIFSDAFQLVDDDTIDIIVELIGGTTVSKDLVVRAIKNGKHVVTANKALIAIHGEELVALAKSNNVILAFEASVAGGIPIIKAIREGLVGNKIEWVAGIINGTTNYILTEMRENRLSFQTALKQAQELGFAEADPTFDIEGIDAAHKLTILASVSFGIPINFDAVYIEGISSLDSIDIGYAEELGYRIKLLAITKCHEDAVELRVHPTLVPEKRLVANVNGPMNAVLVKGNMVGPTLYYGAGAGSEATASSVVADIIDIIRQSEINSEERVPVLGFKPEHIKPKRLLNINEVISEYYLRMTMSNMTGLLARITSIFAKHSISIDAMTQKEVEENAKDVDIILITSPVIEEVMNKIINEIESLPENKNKIIKIRIESLNK